MKIAVASDHRGYQVKAKILDQVAALGHQGLDYGPESGANVDYPDFAASVAQAVSKGEIDRGILICGTGMGMCIVANKFCGVREPNGRDLVDDRFRRRPSRAASGKDRPVRSPERLPASEPVTVDGTVAES
jgi:ribose 5-phosphate isomerase B